MYTPYKTMSTFTKTFSSQFNKTNRRQKSLEPFFSKNETISSFYTPISPKQNFNEPLEQKYNNSYYPSTLKKENFKREINLSLPMLTQFNFLNVVSEREYDNTIKKYKSVYNSLSDNIEEENGYTLNNMINNNKLTGDESDYVKKIIKKKIENYQLI